MYVYRVQKAIGGFYAAMTRYRRRGDDRRHRRELRRAARAHLRRLAHMGMILDRERNHVVGQIGVNRIISIDDSPIKICVVTTDEEMRIAPRNRQLGEPAGVKPCLSAGGKPSIRSPERHFDECRNAARQNGASGLRCLCGITF